MRILSLPSLDIFPLNKNVNQPFIVLKQSPFSFSLRTYVLLAAFSSFLQLFLSTCPPPGSSPLASLPFLPPIPTTPLFPLCGQESDVCTWGPLCILWAPSHLTACWVGPLSGGQRSYYSSRAPMTKYHKVGGLNNRNVTSCNLEAQRPGVAGQVPSETSPWPANGHILLMFSCGLPSVCFYPNPFF